MPRKSSPKPPKHCVVDTAEPAVLISFHDSIKEAKLVAQESETYVACSLAPHPKKTKSK